MKKILIVFMFSIVFLAYTLPSFAQFTPEEVAERPKWEEFLTNAKIVGQEQMTGPEAVTSPWRLSLELDGVTKFALWKDIEGRPKGYVDNWRYEIAAYGFDKYLGLNMVPPTVEKRFQNNRGSCQIFVDYWLSLKKIKDQKIKSPPVKVFFYNRSLYLQRVFDNLIGNEDRHQNNYLITQDWRILLIDHSRTFRTGKKWTTQLFYGPKNPEGLIMKEIPKALFEKIKSLNYDLIKGFVGEYLTDEEINAVLARKDLIIQEYDNLIKKNGEENVLY
jgi:hypothetical protein